MITEGAFGALRQVECEPVRVAVEFPRRVRTQDERGGAALGADDDLGLVEMRVEVSSSSEQPQKSAAALNTTAVRAINRLMKYVFIVQFLLGMDIRYLAKDHSMTTGKWSEGYFCEYEVLTIAHDCTFVRPLVTKIWSMREALAGGVEIYL